MTPAPARLEAAQTMQFALAGNAVFTIVSLKTQARYTYRVRRAKDGKDIWFVSLLTGQNNESDYTYLGVIRNGAFSLTAKSGMKADSLPVAAFAWFFRIAGQSAAVEMWHAGRCGRCGHLLTTPESIAAGFGPVCMGVR